MKVRKKVKKILRRIFNIYNLAIIISIALILIAVYTFLKADEIYETVDGMKVVVTNIKEDEVLSEEKAKEIAVKQFKVLDEKVKKEDLKIMKIRRGSDEYYYINSSKNSMEISVIGGEITRINTALVIQQN